ncbi:glucosyltransferase domain-containing protein [Paenibacillus sp. SC116]|uniref:glucosyltransferase domain-containing protein n=1 Tax=Paenibacillus sp. SC116 TaxID=2968986 RepID=UPI00215A822D|nr:glucosyltransferase domain-containing protein [Paenibacillus sp. SC116]MCR8844855.1 glucosyltransferase domain-containing protein [Paenibacillus sp. SC116]
MKWHKEIAQILSEESRTFLQYLKANKSMCGIVVFFTCLAYWFPLTQFTLSIDEEKSLFTDSINSVWSEQGRFGIALTKILSNTTLTNSITSTILAVTALSLSSIIWAYAFKRASVNNDGVGFDAPGLILSLLFVTFPAFSENIGFSMMSFELGVAWISTSIATVLIFKWAVLKSNHYYLFLGLILTTFATSIYQSYLPVFICGIMICLIIYLLSLQKQNKTLTIKEYFIVLMKYISVTAMSLVLYKVIDRIVGLFIPQSDYISNFIAWGNIDPRLVIKSLAGNFKALIAGELIHGSFMILPSIIVILLVLINFVFKFFIKKTDKGNAMIIGISLIGFISTPFLMQILLGSPMPIRSNLVLTLFIAAVWYFVYVMFDKRAIRNLIMIFILIVSFNQSQSLSQLFYSDYNRYQEDVKLAHQIGYRILELNVGENPSQPVIFVGSRIQQERENVIKQEVLGHSFFEWDGGNPARINFFMRSLGYEYNDPTEEQREKGIEIAKDLPVWPDKNSIILADDIIVVNLPENSNKYLLDMKHVEKEDVGTPTYRIDIKNPDIYYDMKIDADSKGILSMKSGSLDPHISYILNNKVNNNIFEYIAIEFESDTEGEMQVFLSQENESYGEKYNGVVKVKKGYNKVYSKKQQYMTNVAGFRIDPPNNSSIKLIGVTFIK